MEDFEPTVIAFVCNWCTYTAADLAGTSRRSYPKNVRLIRVMSKGPEIRMQAGRDQNAPGLAFRNELMPAKS